MRRGLLHKAVLHPVKAGSGFGQQARLVVLEGQHVLAPLRPDGPGDVRAAVQGIGGDQAAGQPQQGQSLESAGDLVAAGSFLLAEHQAGLGGPDVDQVERVVATALEVGAAQSFAVESHHAFEGHHAFESLGEGAGEAGKGSLEGFGIEQAEDATEGVVAGHAMGHLEQGLEQGALGVAELGHVGTGLGAAQHGHEGDDDHLEQAVAGVGGARVGQVGQQESEG
jgi:hypothetical protein